MSIPTGDTLFPDITEKAGPREISFVLWGHCQNLLDDPRIISKLVTSKIAIF